MSAPPVTVVQSRAGCDWGTPPYAPVSGFPERPAGGGDNALYAAVRQAFLALGMDLTRHGTPAWNPLSVHVPRGGTVVLKPNLVRHRHGNGGPLEAVVTDPRLIRAVLDYAVDAVGPAGEVIIADSPLQSCRMSRLAEMLGLPSLIEAAAAGGTRVRVVDYRREEVVKGDDGLLRSRTPLPGDPEGYVPVDLGDESELLRLGAGDFRVTQYDSRITRRHHSGDLHEFLIPRSLLRADLVISMPKIKTHRKAGMTGALKNLVGINGSKAWLPHHRAGAVSEGGDEYLNPSLRKRWLTRLWSRMDRTSAAGERAVLARVDRLIRRSASLVPFPDPYLEGSWWGNRTMPAMICDLNRIFMYADSEGRLQPRRCRRSLVVADAVLAGEGEGPLEPTPMELGCVIAGVNGVSVDAVAATLMGFDPGRIPTLDLAYSPRTRPLFDVPRAGLMVRVVDANGGGQTLDLAGLAGKVTRPFVPASGWVDHIEARREAS